ncbi:NTPase [Algoriphagus namhaensis]|uniref:NTPase n=1 Tax=Algoriphagus namhaensis TaxID=915353 RepID=A0ABV8AQA5_9BACT
MKYYLPLLLSILISFEANAQGALPESFFDGKAVVLVSVDPAAEPALTWRQVADSLHSSFVEAGADPVAYYELETIALSEDRQATYAKAFEQRQVKNILFITRSKAGYAVHMSPFSGDGKIIPTAALYGLESDNIDELRSRLSAIGESVRTKNLLVIDVPEFGEVLDAAASVSLKYLQEYPLNLEVFKTGVPISGSSATESLISYFRFDLFGKSPEDVLREQSAQKATLESILESNYQYDYVWLTEAKTNQELIADRIQFVLSKVEGRESDMMASMGLEPTPGSERRVVVKYYIKLLVRDELYIGTTWDADSDWRKALENFLKNLNK